MPKFISILIYLFAISPLMTQAGEYTSVTQIWETAAEFSNPESVIHDETRDVLYVSNVNGSPVEKNMNGFISIVSVSGEIIELKAFSDFLWAPKGMAIFNDHLFVADITKVVEIDLETRQIVNYYPVADAVFLNDVAADSNGDIYISDMMTNTIHRLKDGQIKPWVNDPELEYPNGLHVQHNVLIVGSWGVIDQPGFKTTIPGSLKIVSLNSGAITSFSKSDPVGNLDGVEATAQGEFLVTDWIAGKLIHIDHSGIPSTLLTMEQGMADHEYVASTKQIFIPMMLNNKLHAYQFYE